MNGVSRRAMRLRITAVVGSLVVGSGLLSGCVESGGGNASGGEGVTAGASQEEYVEALEDLDKIVLTVQSGSAPGVGSSVAFEAYANAVDEWSGGKVTFNIVYSNGVVPPDQSGPALSDGRLDMAFVLPTYEPSRYPAVNAFAELTYLGSNSPVVGVLQSSAAYLEAALESDAMSDEFEKNDLKVLIPFNPNGSGPGIACADARHSAAQLKNAQTRVGSKADGELASALGMTTVSANFAETYEGLQRGAMDCTVTSVLGALAGGIVPVAPHWTIDDRPGFPRPITSVAMGALKWEQLPLRVQQLLFDRLDVYYEAALYSRWDELVDLAKQIGKAGGKIEPLDEATHAKLDAAHTKTRDKVAKSHPEMIDITETAVEEWGDIVADDLGITDEVGFAEFDTWYSRGKVDLTEYLDRIRTDILDPRRPS